MMSEKISFKQLVGEVRAAYQSGRTRDVTFRKTQLRGLQKMYDDNTEAFCTALAEDLRKPRLETILTEVNLVKDDITYTLNHMDDWVKPELVPRNLVTLFDRPIIYHDPYGVVLVIGAWNYPIQLVLLPMSGAIAAGNCVIVKPSELSPATSRLIAKLVPQYLDEDCYRIVEGGVAETTALLQEKFDYIFYTGSTAVGKIVRRAANEHLTPTTLELGGKSPVYLDDTVDFDIAVRRILWGKLINGGQTCVAPDYLLCSAQVKDKFVLKAKEVLKDFYGQDPKSSPDLCRIVNERHFDRLAEMLKDGTAVIGGECDRSEKYVAPTVLVDVPQDAKVLTEEIFGPILPIVIVESAYDAITYINKRDKALVGYYFSKQQTVLELLLTNTHTGGSCVNDVLLHAGVQSLPFGGVGESGMGSYHGHASYLCFTHRKSCLKRNYNKIADYMGSKRYPPYTESNIGFLSNMLKERWMPSMSFMPYLLSFGLGAATVLASAYIAKISDDIMDAVARFLH